MAVDYGEKRIGLAIADPSGMIASPAGFIERRAGKRPPVAEIIRRAEALGRTRGEEAEILPLYDEVEAKGFVVGLPLDGNGDETPRSGETRQVAAALAERTKLPVELIDERFTTAAARLAIREMGGSIKDRRGDVDALAATVLLQHALAHR